MTLTLRNVRPYGEDAVDITVSDGRITDLAPAGSASGSADLVIDGRGLVVLPGFVDLHTHLREPGREDAETIASGTAAAALGGFTAVHAMANTTPVADTAGVVEQVWRRGVEAGYCDVHPVGAVTVGLKGEHLAELGAMADSAARVRVFSDDGVCVSDPVLMRRALEYVKAFDGVIAPTEASGRHHRLHHHGEGGLQAEHPEGARCPLAVLVLARMRCMVGRHRVDRAVREAFTNGLNVIGGAQGRIHLVARVIGTREFLGEDQVMRSDLSGDVDSALLGPPHDRHGSARGEMADVHA